MEFSLIIPNAVSKILEQDNMKKIEKEKCSHCIIPCDKMTKFICLGGSAATIGEYIKNHPTEIQNLEKLSFDDDDNDDNFDNFCAPSPFNDEGFI